MKRRKKRPIIKQCEELLEGMKNAPGRSYPIVDRHKKHLQDYMKANKL